MLNARRPLVFALLTIILLAVADALLPSVDVGALVTVPLLVIASRVRFVTSLLLALCVACLFGFIDYSSYFPHVTGAETLPVNTAVLMVAFGSVVVVSSALTVETRKRYRVEHDLALTLQMNSAERRRSFTDPLTGLLNRRGLHDAFTNMLADGEKTSNATLIFLDLDGFKAINDTYGHRFGDELLQLTARRITDAVRANDLVARFGGDEFVIVCYARTSAEDYGKRIAAGIEAAFTKPVAIGSTSISISASIGIATSTEAGSDVAALLEVADERMYAHKSRRNAQSISEA